jgi:hypothetical protein
MTLSLVVGVSLIMLISVASPFMSSVLICDWPARSCSDHTAIGEAVGTARGKGWAESGAVAPDRKIPLQMARISTMAAVAARR